MCRSVWITCKLRQITIVSIERERRDQTHTDTEFLFFFGDFVRCVLSLKQQTTTFRAEYIYTYCIWWWMSIGIMCVYLFTSKQFHDNKKVPNRICIWWYFDACSAFATLSNWASPHPTPSLHIAWTPIAYFFWNRFFFHTKLNIIASFAIRLHILFALCIYIIWFFRSH